MIVSNFECALRRRLMKIMITFCQTMILVEIHIELNFPELAIRA